ncbi:acylphosphatase [Uliginosibacterium sp. H3]|uniref:Acylphosphatase n=1 Tax=Uliginosibacterium silvisoli TaxID=3114758 RepID=A0ABU6K3J1_9RHOO|nr:acylphosphatase [Uliginosibacterium sp. H3]
MSIDDIVARRLIVRGLVQGVGFRWSTVEEARRLGLGGWVRNRRDGSVEALVCGPNAAVAAMIHWAGKGPAGARVDGIEVEDSSERHDAFAQLPTV